MNTFDFIKIKAMPHTKQNQKLKDKWQVRQILTT